MKYAKKLHKNEFVIRSIKLQFWKAIDFCYGQTAFFSPHMFRFSYRRSPPNRNGNIDRE